MDPAVMESVVMLVGLLGMGGVVLLGMRMRYEYKSKKLEQSTSVEDMERLVDALDGLYDQAKAIREEMGELQERMDFHERLLTKAKEKE